MRSKELGLIEPSFPDEEIIEGDDNEINGKMNKNGVLLPNTNSISQNSIDNANKIDKSQPFDAEDLISFTINESEFE
jgi:hypothetical protein